MNATFYKYVTYRTGGLMMFFSILLEFWRKSFWRPGWWLEAKCGEAGNLESSRTTKELEGMR